jgi:exonuclease VII large subunit
MDKYPKHIIDYAIDNKVSLEEAYNHYILHGKQEKKREEEQLKPEKPQDFNIEEEEQFLSELEQKIKDQLSEDVMNDEEWWNKWHKKMDKISELENELDMSKEYYDKPYNKDKITKEEMDWVEAELEQVDKLYNEMYREDV